MEHEDQEKGCDFEDVYSHSIEGRDAIDGGLDMGQLSEDLYTSHRKVGRRVGHQTQKQRPGTRSQGLHGNLQVVYGGVGTDGDGECPEMDDSQYTQI